MPAIRGPLAHNERGGGEKIVGSDFPIRLSSLVYVGKDGDGPEALEAEGKQKKGLRMKAP